MTRFEKENCLKCEYVIREKLGTKEASCSFSLKKGFPPCLQKGATVVALGK